MYKVKLQGQDSYGFWLDDSSEMMHIPPLVEPSFTLRDTLGCQYVGVQFTNTTLGARARAASHLWDFGDGSTDTAFHATHVYTKSGLYQVTLHVTSDSCTYSYTYPLNIYISPAADPRIRVETEGCAPFQLYATSPKDAEALYNIYILEGDTVQASSFSQVLDTGTYSFKHCVFSRSGCFPCDSHQVRVHPALRSTPGFSCAHEEEGGTRLTWPSSPDAQAYQLTLIVDGTKHTLSTSDTSILIQGEIESVDLALDGWCDERSDRVGYVPPSLSITEEGEQITLHPSPAFPALPALYKARYLSREGWQKVTEGTEDELSHELGASEMDT